MCASAHCFVASQDLAPWPGGKGGEPVYDHIGLRGGLVSYGEGEEGGRATQRQPKATQGRPRHPPQLSRVPEPPGAAQYTGQLRISRGKQPLCDARPSGALALEPDQLAAPIPLGSGGFSKRITAPWIRQRSQGNTQKHMEVLALIVGYIVSSLVGPGSCWPVGLRRKPISLQLSWDPAMACIPSEFWFWSPPIFARRVGGSRKWCNTLSPHCRTFGCSSGRPIRI